MRSIGLFADSSALAGPADHIAFRQFGGIKIFAASSRDLAAAVDRTCRGIIHISGNSWALTPSLLRYLVQHELDAEVPKRVFGALLGYTLHNGELDGIICEGSQGGAFRVVLHRNRLKDFHCRTREIADDLCKFGILRLSELRDRYFEGKTKGGWTQVMYVAARLVRLGIAEYRDQYSIQIPDLISNAILHADELLNTADTQRVDTT